MRLFKRYKYYIDGKKVSKKYFEYNIKMMMLITDTETIEKLVKVYDCQNYSADEVCSIMLSIFDRYKVILDDVMNKGFIDLLGCKYEVRRA